MSQYALPSNSGMTPAKRLRALTPAILVLLAFVAFYVIVNGLRPFAVIKRPDAKFPMTGIYWGLDRIESSGTPVPFYFDATGVAPQTQGTPPLLANPDGKTPNIDQHIEAWRATKPKPTR